MTTETSQMSDLQSSSWFMDITGLDNLTIKIKEFSIPSVSAGTTKVPNRTEHPYFEGGDHIYFDDLEIKFFVDKNLDNYRKLLEWMKTNAHNNQADMSSVFLHVLDNQRRLQGVELEFIDAFPIRLSELKMETDAFDTNVTCEVTFRYQTMEFVDDTSMSFYDY